MLKVAPTLARPKKNLSDMFVLSAAIFKFSLCYIIKRKPQRNPYVAEGEHTAVLKMENFWKKMYLVFNSAPSLNWKKIWLHFKIIALFSKSMPLWTTLALKPRNFDHAIPLFLALTKYLTQIGLLWKLKIAVYEVIYFRVW